MSAVWGSRPKGGNLMSEKISPHHLERKAILYVRQSSAFQVAHNQESRRLQYAMRDRLRDLGWQDIEVVDEDLGRSAAGTVLRSGFERMVADVCLGKVGAVAAREVSRFARNSREWQQLIEVCRLVDTVLVDQEVVYAPRLSNDRLLLGLKGSLNEYELDLLRQRSLEARYEKARRGELLVSAPVGYLKTEAHKLEKDPDLRVQERVGIVFRKFLELGSIRQTLLWFLEEDLRVPSRSADGTLSWKRPRYSSVQNILTNPTYGGAYVFGRVEHGTRYDNGRPRKVSRRRSPEEWISLIPDHHEPYISWDRFQQIQEMIAGNCTGGGRRGAAKQGAALLAGILRCRRCGRKLTVSYTGGNGRFLRYACLRGTLDNGEPKCISFGGIPVDERIGEDVVRVVEPGALKAAVQACQDIAKQRDEVVEALERDLEAARYAARRAEKQYDATDPENRLVAEELERRWDTSLERVRQLERRLEEYRGRSETLPVATMDEFAGLADDLEAVWNDPKSDARLKKRIVRTLIREVVADIDQETSEVILVIHWQGGVHTELRVPRRKRGTATRTASGTLSAVRILARVSTDKMIAGFLNRNGLRTARGNRWTQERVTSLRTYHKIPNYSPEAKEREGWLNLTEAATVLGISSRTLRLAVERGELSGEHPLPDGPWVFRRRDLESDAANQLVKRVQSRDRTPAVPAPGQQTLDLART
jgi:DNA invertase Pin-like site-specific DNA recombinase